MMARSRQRVRLEDGLKLNINKLIGRGGIQPGSKTRAIVGCPQAYGGQSLSGVLTADLSYPVRGWMRLELGSEAATTISSGSAEADANSVGGNGAVGGVRAASPEGGRR